MQYMLLIYGDESGNETTDSEQGRTMMTEYREYTQALIDEGKMRAGDALQPTTSATTVRVRDGETILTDGPFAETREQLGGYYLIEAASLDEAVDAARRIPGARSGSIEVRPVVVFD
jgi:hypothetical protein